MATNQHKVGQNKSEVIAAVPLACADEEKAAEFIEDLRWGTTPECPHCHKTDVYKMTERKSGKRNKRLFLRFGTRPHLRFGSNVSYFRFRARS